uniref:hypothetical protein n=1 Tax=Paractinoplanes polyasparticus TaxID=2856853 RepID=UPI001C844FC8|nr:hypothetical protein [Actinoplanes polyasparticus]
MVLSRMLGRRRPPTRPEPSRRLLFVEWLDQAAVVSHADDPPLVLWQLLRNAQRPGGDLLITASPRAVGDAACGTVLRRTVESAAKVWGVRRAWLAVDYIGRPQEAYASWLLRLAERAGVELLAPDGPLHVTPDGTFYVAPDAGLGWRSYRSGGGALVTTRRYPPPVWEQMLPDRPMPLPGLVAEPIPAGLLLHSARRSPGPDDPAYHVPVDPAGPVLVLRHIGDPPVDPRQVAELFTGLPAGIPVLVRSDGPTIAAGWRETLVRALATTSGEAVVSRPRLPMGVGPAPLRDGWVRAAERLYRHRAVRGLLAEVNSAGIVLRADSASGQDSGALVDPDEGVLVVDRTLSDPLTGMLTSFLTASTTQPGLALVGEGAPLVQAMLDRGTRAGPAPVLPVSEPVPAATAAPAPAAEPVLVSEPVRNDEPVRDDEPVVATPSVVPAVPAVAVAPVMTVSGPEPEPEQSFATASAGSPAPNFAAVPAAERKIPVRPAASPAVSRYEPAVPAAITERGSTGDERQAFVTALGPAYTDSITTVNAALAAWPALRQDTSAAAKTDLVAVRVFFGSSAAGASELNVELRAGRSAPLAGYLPCLISGLRRLPPCRRAVVCQARIGVPAERLYREGATLVESGFRTAGGADGLSVADADIDYLIWSRTARQAGVLGEEGLDEVVFLAGARFKVLGVRTGEADTAGLPRTAVLLRELLVGETTTAGLDDADRSVLGRLERALARRRSAPRIDLTEAGSDAAGRLMGPPLGFTDSGAA